MPVGSFAIAPITKFMRVAGAQYSTSLDRRQIMGVTGPLGANYFGTVRSLGGDAEAPAKRRVGPTTNVRAKYWCCMRWTLWNVQCDE